MHDILVMNHTDWTQGVMKAVFRKTWPLFITIHLVLGIAGLFVSGCMTIDLYYSRLHRTSTGKYLCNIIVFNVLTVVIELPLHCIIMLYENWLWGMMVCFISAVLPYMLVHGTILSFLALTIDRYWSITHPSKRQINPTLCLLLIWVSAMCFSMPMVTFMQYEDISHFNARWANNGLCWSTGTKYNSIIFISIFALPVGLVVLILLKTSSELKTKEALYKVHELYNRARPPDADSIDINSINGDEFQVGKFRHCYLLRVEVYFLIIIIIILLLLLFLLFYYYMQSIDRSI